MKRKFPILLLSSGFLLGACSGSEDSGLFKEVTRDRSKGTYTVTLTEIELVKKGSSQTLPVPDLPVNGATLTRE